MTRIREHGPASTGYGVLIGIAISVFIITPALAEPVEYRIGANLPLTGPLAEHGTDVLNGLTLGAETFSDSKIHFKVIAEDNQFNLTDAASAAKKLIENDNTDAVVTLWESADVVAPIVERSSALHFTIRWDPAVAERYPHTFQIEPTYFQAMNSLVDLVKRRGANRVGVLYQQNVAGVLAKDAFLKSAEIAHIEIPSVIEFAPGATDYRSILSKLFQVKPDLIFVMAYSPDLDVILEQLQVLRPNFPVSGLFETLSPRKSLEHQPYINITDVSPEFSDMFLKRFSHPFVLRAPHAFEIVRLLHAAIEKANTLQLQDRDQIGKALVELEPIAGYLGALKTSEQRSIAMPCCRWDVVENGVRHRLTAEDVSNNYGIQTTR